MYKCLDSLQAITSVHTLCHHSLRSIANHSPTYICRCMSCFLHAIWFGTNLCDFFPLLGNWIVLLLPSVFWCSFMSWGYVFFVSVCLLVFLHCKHPVYCFSAHSSPALFSPTVWSHHQKELVVSRFSKSWGEQKVEGFFRSKISLLNLLLCPESQSAIIKMTHNFLTCHNFQMNRSIDRSIDRSSYLHLDSIIDCELYPYIMVHACTHWQYKYPT